MDKRILVVDDEPDMVLLVRTLLSTPTNGFKVETACSGGEALTRMEAQQADLIITDLQMPGMSGLVLMEQVRNLYPDTRLVLMSGCLSTQVAAAACQLGACGQITKPFSIDELLAAVHTALAKGD